VAARIVQQGSENPRIGQIAEMIHIAIHAAAQSSDRCARL
jgi:hypothetical protein